MTLEELKSAEQIVKQKNQDIGKNSKLINSNNQVETNNNSTINIETPQVSLIYIQKCIDILLFSL